MAESLKNKIINGGLWNGLERVLTSALLLISNIILASLLFPEDFGAIGLLMTFIHLSDAIVDGGFGAALVQKQNATEADYSTIFYWNISVSSIIYLLLFIFSPKLEIWFNIPHLSSLFRVLGLALIINSLSIIQRTILIKNLKLKQVAKITVFANIVSTIVCVVCAYLGCGVWSLVVKYLLTYLSIALLLWSKTSWYPSRIFSTESFRQLFKFGGFMFLTSVVNSLYQNIISFILGKKFSPSDLGYFTQARKLQDVPREAFTSVISNVIFPAFSTIQNEKERLVEGVKKSLAAISYLSFPLTVFLMLAARPLIILFFTEKWLPSVRYMQIICIYGLFMSIIDFNHGILKSLGKTRILFLTGIIRKSIGIAMIIVGAFWGINGLLCGYILSQVVGFWIVAYPQKKLIGYGFLPQCRCIFQSFLISAITGVATYFITHPLNVNNISLLIIQFLLFSTIYLGISYIFKVSSFFILKEMLMQHIKNGKFFKRIS